MFKKILIANRGEIAVRIIRACRELDVRTVAVYSDVDRSSMHVRLADEAICIGPAQPEQSYLSVPAILTSAEITDSEAIHPGYGFLSENPQFAEACAASGIAFIGPSPENIRLGGDKAKARQVMKKRGVPVVPGSDGPLDGAASALKAAKKIGFPCIIKASMGGGGRGMKIVNSEEQVEDAYFMAQREALTGFGSSELYLEKYLQDVRHIEVQVLADTKGRIIHLGERECSIQRRHQKLIEESPSPFVSEKLRKRLGELAIKAARAVKYKNIGTVEFMVTPAEEIYFMEFNTRVQVEHPVTEIVMGMDLVKEQILLAAGQSITMKKIFRPRGAAIECRINAEDPDRFIPSPGTIEFLHQPGGPGIRVDTAAYCGWTVPSHYDSLIAKLIAFGSNRQEAIARMRRALDEFVIEGIKTTIPFHKRVIENRNFQEGRINTSFLERMNDPEKAEVKK
ncbi:MAG: acetyl-CoA carboxylase biotin carboxylase subunit [Nitrospiraceae bacterium]|nr:acetyl-CoA carboxylase biotin carboxylase subunit [Nitrospiraceae bacterium]